MAIFCLLPSSHTLSIILSLSSYLSLSHTVSNKNKALLKSDSSNQKQPQSLFLEAFEGKKWRVSIYMYFFCRSVTQSDDDGRKNVYIRRKRKRKRKGERERKKNRSNDLKGAKYRSNVVCARLAGWIRNERPVWRHIFVCGRGWVAIVDFLLVLLLFDLCIMVGLFTADS